MGTREGGRRLHRALTLARRSDALLARHEGSRGDEADQQPHIPQADETGERATGTVDYL